MKGPRSGMKGSGSSNVEAEADISLATEGFEPGDIWGLAKRLAVQAARRGGNNPLFLLGGLGGEESKGGHASVGEAGDVGGAGGSVLYTTHTEALSAAKDFSSKFSSSSTSSAPSTVCWSDIGGLHSAKVAITDVFQLPVIFRKLFRLSPIRMPRAILLYGPPGCGKTILAQAAANECGLAFISVRGECGDNHVRLLVCIDCLIPPSSHSAFETYRSTEKTSSVLNPRIEIRIPLRNTVLRIENWKIRLCFHFIPQKLSLFVISRQSTTVLLNRENVTLVSHVSQYSQHPSILPSFLLLRPSFLSFFFLLPFFLPSILSSVLPSFPLPPSPLQVLSS